VSTLFTSYLVSVKIWLVKSFVATRNERQAPIDKEISGK
jgi:hypothetical protein